MTFIAGAILAAIALSGLLEVYLQRRQGAAVAQHRERVPADFADAVTLEEHRRAADYTLARLRWSEAQGAFEAIMAVFWLAVLLAPFYRAVAEAVAPGLSRSAAVVIGMTLIGHVLDLPFSIVRIFRIEARFGFNRTTPALFVRDQLKELALQLALAVPFLYGLFGLIAIAPDLWWLYGWAGAMAIMAALMVIYPTFIAPLFNAFTPMADGAMKTRVDALLAKCGFESKGVFVMDASKRSGHGNAYFWGFGKAKRIVFFDTLLEKHTPDEIESVLAHELGHYKLGHVWKRLALTAFSALVAFALLHWAFAFGWLAQQFGLPNDPGLVVIILALAMGPIAHLLSPLTNGLSRRAEFQADRFAKTMVGAEPMIGALVRLSRDNLSTLTPDHLYALFHYSHPPVPERIAHLRATE